MGAAKYLAFVAKSPYTWIVRPTHFSAQKQGERKERDERENTTRGHDCCLVWMQIGETESPLRPSAQAVLGNQHSQCLPYFPGGGSSKEDGEGRTEGLGHVRQIGVVYGAALGDNSSTQFALLEKLPFTLLVNFGVFQLGDAGDDGGVALI